MDMMTVKSRIKCSHYTSIDEFLEDMNLIFSNSLNYNKKRSKIGKAADLLKQYFEKRCSDLGLKDLRLSKGIGHVRLERNSGGTFSTCRRSNRLKH